ncbi:endonuclease III domain-containing protein [Actinosynnema sp. CA-299493]
MPPSLVLPFPVQPDLVGTMDIQVPALAWAPLTDDRFRRVYRLDGHAVTVDVAEGDRALRFDHDAPDDRTAALLHGLLRRTFTRTIGDLVLDAHPILSALHQRYRNVVIMHSPPFEALVLTILSQNRTGEIVRRVYPRLDARCRGVTPHTLLELGLDELRELIRSTGPYKAPRLLETAGRIADQGEDAFRARVVDAPGPEALAYLESFPGVAHKTAACVLVYATGGTTTLPVDTHLFRVVDRLGLARHQGANNKSTREALIGTLLGYGPDLAPAHFLFLLLGRDVCGKTAPACTRCFLRHQCRFALAAALPETT